MNKINSPRFVPLVVAIGIVFGILIGSFYANHYSGNRLNIINTSSNKINDLLHIIDAQYVDKVNISDLVEKAMPQILRELDPHSTYTTAKDVEASMEGLKGSFSGIGVQFTIYDDTVRVIRVLPGGPSEDVGLMAGDRIVAVDGKAYTGKVVTDTTTMKLLKGPAESSVRLGVVRPGTKKQLSFTIVRGDVPVKSIDAVYMLDKTTGYIRITNFSETTYSEFLAALARLNHDGFRSLVLDLRGNLGGYMAPSVQIANEFLPKGRLILYTEGHRSPRKEYMSDGRGTYQSLPLVVLIDEGTASSSEILAGAIQDNDRGTVVGRRSFGKGLVQEPIEFSDGSMLRLTIARYYTPSGRCLQKPYVPGDEDAYENDLFERAVHGEYFSRDSIRTGGKAYKTVGGRTVYGGGGIIPDIFIPRDTLGMTSYFKEAYLRGLLYLFACDFVDDHRFDLRKCVTVDDVVAYLDRRDVPQAFAAYGEGHGLKRRNLMLRTSHDLFVNYIYGYIIDQLLGEAASAEYINRTDLAVQQALNVIRERRTFPAQEKSVPKQQAQVVGAALRLMCPSPVIYSWISPFRPVCPSFPRSHSAVS